MDSVNIYRDSGGFVFTYVKNNEANTKPIPLPENLAYIITDLDSYVSSLEDKEKKVFDYFIASAPDEEKLSLIDLYPKYSVAKDYIAGDEFAYDNKLFKVLQAHTSQYSWKPTIVPALYKEIALPGTVPNFVQPTGAHNAYNEGDKVIFEEKEYISLIDGNSWSPSTYPQGWVLSTTTQIPGEEPPAEEPIVEEPIPEFVQPTGVHNVYNTGDHVMFEGAEYVSLIDNNSYSPTAYPQGWELV